MSESEITPGERRELRSVVKGRFKVLRAEVKRREAELRAEVEQEILERYREQDTAISAARHEIERLMDDFLRQAREIAHQLELAHPTLEVKAGWGYNGFDFHAQDRNRTQLHRAAMAAIPNRIGDAQLALDHQGMDLLTNLSATAISSGEARQFLGGIPTVGELVPRARLKELESSLRQTGDVA